MRIFRLIFVFVLTAAGIVQSATELDFSKKRNYFLGEGEYGSVTLQLKSAETYNFEPGISRPFVLKKLDNSGTIQVIYDARTLDNSALKDGSTMTTSFVFTKKNIGKKELLNVSAIYRPEVRIMTPDSLLMDFSQLNFTPENRTLTLKINSLKKVTNLIVDDPENILTFGGDDRLTLEKGINDINITFNGQENFSGEVMAYRKLSEGKINQLYFLVSAKNFKAIQVDGEVETVSENEIRQMMIEDSLEQAGLYAEMGEQSADGSSDGGGSGKMFSTFALIVIAFLALIILVLLAFIMIKKKNPLFDTYATFYDDVATLLKVPVKGVNIDKSTEEIMMILLDKFDYGMPDQPEVKQAEAKKILKKPAGLKTPAPDRTVEAQDTGSIDLDFGSDPDAGKTDKTEEKKISRGFDFLDED
ncbi:MAG: hypothetical protein WC212_04725 [Candidatus Delongbacteria bacterium]